MPATFCVIVRSSRVAPCMKSYRALCEDGLAVRRKSPPLWRDGLGDRLAGEEIVAEIDWPQTGEPRAVCREPALGGVALAILLLRAVLGRDEFRHQGKRLRLARRDDRRRQHGMVAFDHAVGALAGEALRAAELLRAEIFGAVERDEGAAAEPLEGAQAAALAQQVERVIEGRLQVRWDAPDRASRGYDCPSGSPPCRTRSGSSTSCGLPPTCADRRGRTPTA